MPDDVKDEPHKDAASKVLDRYDDPRLRNRRERTKPLGKRGIGLTAAEQKRVHIQEARGVRKPSKYKRYDGRLLRNTRPRAQEAIRSFWQEVDVPEFKAALELSPDPKFKMLLYAIVSPRLKSCSFGEIVRRCNLTVNDISNLWRNHQVFRGMMKMMNHMPQVMEDVAEDAKSRMVTCPRCVGEGKLNGETVNKKTDPICPECHGDGKIRIIGDKDSRALLFESGGLKKGAPGTQVNVNVGAVPTMEQMIEDAENALDAKIIDVEASDAGDGGEKAFEEAGKEVGSDSGAAVAGDAADTTADEVTS